MDNKPGLGARLKLRWRVWRRDPALLQEIARSALMRTGVCDESDSMVRFGWDRDTGQLIVMIYLSHFDHAAWTMSRHIEGYLMRQFKGLYGIPVHSVHLGVIRARAFKEMPAIKSASSLRAVLRERRSAGVKSTGVTGKNIAHDSPVSAPASDIAYADTGRAELEPLASALNPADAAKARGKGQVRKYLDTDEYLSIPGYEVSEVNFDEFLSSLPPESKLPAGMADSRNPPQELNGRSTKAKAAPGEDAAFVAEADLMKRERDG